MVIGIHRVFWLNRRLSTLLSALTDPLITILDRDFRTSPAFANKDTQFIMSFVQKIAANDPTFKELRLSESSEHYFSDVSEMVAALGQNTVIDYVRIDRDFLPSLLGEPEKKAAIVIAIGKLPALRELRIMSGPVHANVLGLALNDVANLENLELVCIVTPQGHRRGHRADIRFFCSSGCH